MTDNQKATELRQLLEQEAAGWAVDTAADFDRQCVSFRFSNSSGSVRTLKIPLEFLEDMGATLILDRLKSLNWKGRVLEGPKGPFILTNSGLDTE